MNPDRLAELEEERSFLLRSLSDLEREYRAGDVDDTDYAELKDGYTVRAAATLRAIEAGRDALPDRSPVDWRRRIYAAVMAVALIAVITWALVASSAERLAGQEITGLDPRGERQTVLAQARAIQANDPGAAAALYGAVLEDDPDNVEALTYRGWNLTLDARNLSDSDALVAQLGEGISLLQAAAESDPTYADPNCFLGIIYFRDLQLADEALPRIDTCLSLGPPADIRGMVEAFRDRVATAAETATATTESGQ